MSRQPALSALPWMPMFDCQAYLSSPPCDFVSCKVAVEFYAPTGIPVGERVHVADDGNTSEIVLVTPPCRLQGKLGKEALADRRS
eukprot:8156842-Pyramimonas_sp.AAC.1